jgi:hypothetical protein
MSSSTCWDKQINVGQKHSNNTEELKQNCPEGWTGYKTTLQSCHCNTAPHNKATVKGYLPWTIEPDNAGSGVVWLRVLHCCNRFGHKGCLLSISWSTFFVWKTYLDLTGPPTVAARDSSSLRLTSTSWVVGLGGVGRGMLGSCTNGWFGTPHDRPDIPPRSFDPGRLDKCVPVLLLELKAQNRNISTRWKREKVRWSGQAQTAWLDRYLKSDYNEDELFSTKQWSEMSV